MSYNCPNCQRVLDDRQLAHCSSCGAPIPESLRFTEEEIAARELMGDFQAEFERLVQLDKEWRDYFAQQTAERSGSTERRDDTEISNQARLTRRR